MRDRAALEREVADLGIAREVFGSDSRTRVSNNEAIPFRWICQVETTLFNGDSSTGTGFLIGPRHVLTTAHTIYPVKEGKVRPAWKTKKVRVYPGRHGAREPFGGHDANGWAIRRGWITADREAYCAFDFGLIRLKEDFAKRGIGFWGSDSTTRFVPINPTTLTTGQRLFTAGYPFRKGLNELAARVMKQSNGQITGSALLRRCAPTRAAGETFTNVDARAHVLRHDVDTEKGSSGGPLWIEEEKVKTLVAIHQGEFDGANAGILITQAVFDQIQEWIRDFTERRRGR